MPPLPSIAYLAGLLASAVVLLASCSDTMVVIPTPTITPQEDTLNVGLPQPDGLTLRGHLFSPDNEIAIVLTHEWQSDQRAWFEFAQVLSDEGYAVFTFDFRGHGETGGETDAELLDDDLRSALSYLRTLGKDRMFLVGASMGGTTSLVVAAEEDVLGVVALSPPAQFEEQDALAAAPIVTEAKLLLATEGDAPSLSFEELLGVAAQPFESELYGGTAHGTDILCEPSCLDEESASIAAAAKVRILSFLAAQAGP